MSETFGTRITSSGNLQLSKSCSATRAPCCTAVKLTKLHGGILLKNESQRKFCLAGILAMTGHKSEPSSLSSYWSGHQSRVLVRTWLRTFGKAVTDKQSNSVDLHKGDTTWNRLCELACRCSCSSSPCISSEDCLRR